MSSFSNPFTSNPGFPSNMAPGSLPSMAKMGRGTSIGFGYGGSTTPGQMHTAAGQMFQQGESARLAQDHQRALMDIMGGFQTNPQQLMQRGMEGGIGGHHLLGAVALDDLAARQAEAMNYGNVMSAVGAIRGAAESGASDIRTAGLMDLVKMRRQGEEAVALADKAFEDLQKQFAAAGQRYDRDYAQARADQQRAIAQFGQAMEAQQSAVSQAVAQQQSERRDQLAAQMGGAIPGTTGQFEEASRQMQAEADRLKFKSLTDIAVEKERTTAGLQQTLAGMQQRSAEFRAGLGQAEAQMGFQARLGQQQARQLAAGLYQAAAQQQAASAQAAAQLRLSGQNAAANYIVSRPFSPVSMLQTMITAMNAQASVSRNQFGVVGGVSAPMSGARFGGGLTSGFTVRPRQSQTPDSTPDTPAPAPNTPAEPTPSGTGLLDEESARRLFGDTGPFDPGVLAYQEERRRGII